MDFSIEFEQGKPQMSYSPESGHRTLFVTSILVRKGAFFHAPWFGSRCHTVKTTTDQSLARFYDFAMEAWRWIVDTRKAAKIILTVARDTLISGRVVFFVTEERSDGQADEFSIFYKVV